MKVVGVSSSLCLPWEVIVHGLAQEGYRQESYASTELFRMSYALNIRLARTVKNHWIGWLKRRRIEAVY